MNSPDTTRSTEPGRGTESDRGTESGHTSAGQHDGGRADGNSPQRRGIRRLWIAGLFAALLLAGVVSHYASASPDGLEKVAADQGIATKAHDHAAKDSPLADYQTKDIADPRFSGGLAGAIGVVATLTVGTGVFWLVRRRTPAMAAPDASAAPRTRTDREVGAASDADREPAPGDGGAPRDGG